jgi:hypothetical protein
MHFEWWTTVEIPFELIEINQNDFFDVLMANFYKCGIGTSIPHFLSWSHISANMPYFHLTEYFGEFYLN